MRYLDDEEGVSPVIGVILMVAITVMLAVVVVMFASRMTTTPTVPAITNLKIIDVPGALTPAAGEKIVMLRMTSNPMGSEIRVSELRFMAGNSESAMVDVQPVNVGKTDSMKDVWNVGDTVTLREVISNIDPGAVYIDIIAGDQTIYSSKSYLG